MANSKGADAKVQALRSRISSIKNQTTSAPQILTPVGMIDLKGRALLPARQYGAML